MTVKWFPENFLKEADRIVGRNLEEVAEKVEADAKTFCPVDSGDLKKSIKNYKSKHKDGGYIVWAGGGEEYYASFVELGSVKMAAKPFLNPALEKNKSFMRKVFGAK